MIQTRFVLEAGTGPCPIGPPGGTISREGRGGWLAPIAALGVAGMRTFGRAEEGGKATKRASLRGVLRPIALPISNMRR
jgi:hypothetical protein